MPSLNKAIEGDEGGYGNIYFLAAAVAPISCPAKTVAKSMVSVGEKGYKSQVLHKKEMCQSIIDKNNVEEIIPEKNTDVIETLEKQLNNTSQEKNQKVDVTSISNSEVINEEILSDLAENVEHDAYIDRLSQQEINEIEVLINEKNREKSKYLINAERAEKASQSLFKKAKETDEEIKSLNSKIRAVSISNTSNI